ncbi:MAG: hypothetical protein ACRBCT_07845 [Alphaproteobacteria bacterium]
MKKNVITGPWVNAAVDFAKSEKPGKIVSSRPALIAYSVAITLGLMAYWNQDKKFIPPTE